MKIDDGQRALARKMWEEDGMSLGEIADGLACSIYDLSPWIYRDELRALAVDAERLLDEGTEA